MHDSYGQGRQSPFELRDENMLKRINSKLDMAEKNIKQT